MMESCGTPQYISPEILLNQGYDKQIDMWSCGVLFYQLVCGTLPFKNKNKQAIFEDIKNVKFY